MRSIIGERHTFPRQTARTTKLFTPMTPPMPRR
jgi:hypothetical protein